jgi:hypothetical protein
VLFLIDYDRRAGKITEMLRYDDSQRLSAVEDRLRLELAHNAAGIEREVVLLEAADEAAIRVTHRRYFADLAELAKLPDRNGSRPHNR